jgi:hypothetical protein
MSSLMLSIRLSESLGARLSRAVRSKNELYVAFGVVLDPHGSRDAVDVNHVHGLGLGEGDDVERACHAGVAAGPEGQHLEADVGELSRLQQVLQLRAHDFGAADLLS